VKLRNWVLRRRLSLGGAVSFGFPDDDSLLVVSWNGRGLYNILDLTRVARIPGELNGADWLRDDGTTVKGIGQFSQSWVSTFGLFGGDPIIRTFDGYRINFVTSGNETIGCNVSSPDDAIQSIHIEDTSEFRAASFNPNGRFFVMLYSDVLVTYERSTD